jgi:hypothetical protein
MKIRTRRVIALLAAVCGIVGLVVFAGAGRSQSERPNTVHFLSITNGLVGPISTTYQTFSTNTAAIIQKWLHDGTNAAVLRVTNNRPCAIWLFPFPRIQTTSKPSFCYDSILLDAPTFSGIRLPAGEATNIQIAIFVPQNERWRIEVGYTEERGGSLVDLLRNLPGDLRAFGSKQIVQHTIPIQSEWIPP